MKAPINQDKIWNHDGSFIGLMSTCAKAFSLRSAFDPIPNITSNRDQLLAQKPETQKDLFADQTVQEGSDTLTINSIVIQIESNQNEARTFFRLLKNIAGGETSDALFCAWHSDQKNLDNAASIFIASALDSGSATCGDLVNPHINAIMGAAQRARREKHLFMGIVRFRELSDGTFYAPINPDCDILPLIAGHFHDRFFSQDWIIHDVNKGKSLFHQKNGSTSGIDIEEIDGLKISDLQKGADIPDVLLAQREKIISEAFRLYYSDISIPERSNPSVQRNFLPKKYWLHLIEKPGIK